MKHISFFRFLKQHNALEEFKYNFENSSYSGFFTLSDYFNQTPINDWILHAFDWYTSQIGGETWYQLHFDWIKYSETIDSFSLNKNIRIL